MLKYKEKSLRLLIPNKNIEQKNIKQLFDMVDNTINAMLKDNTFKSFQLQSMISDNIEIKGSFYSVYNINGFLPPHAVNSILNLFKYVVINVGGEIAKDKEYIDDFEIKWEGMKTKNTLLKLLKANERVEWDVEQHKKEFNIFCETLENM